MMTNDEVIKQHMDVKNVVNTIFEREKDYINRIFDKKYPAGVIWKCQGWNNSDDIVTINFEIEHHNSIDSDIHEAIAKRIKRDFNINISVDGSTRFDGNNGSCIKQYKILKDKKWEVLFDVCDFNLLESKVASDEKIDIYRDNKWIVVRPLTQRAAMKYGAFTNWCTSTSDPKYMSWYNNETSFFIYIIDRTKTPPPLEIRNAKVKHYQDIYDQLDDISDKEEEIGIDLCRIAILIEWSNPDMDEYPDTRMYDANNIDLYEFDYYGINDLPIPEQVQEAIYNYIDQWVSAFKEKELVAEKFKISFEEFLIYTKNKK
jgi:hypothetical protein